jgi:hypothetical protein
MRLGVRVLFRETIERDPCNKRKRAVRGVQSKVAAAAAAEWAKLISLCQSMTRTQTFDGNCDRQ